MASTIGLMTVAQYRELSETGPYDYELHHGVLVEASKPTPRHTNLQKRLSDLLEPVLAEYGIVLIELSFRALPEHELRATDVAFVTYERWRRTDKDDAVHGSPDIVVEVLSPSNKRTETAERCTLCLANGSREFWTVDERRREIKVSTPDGITRTYKSGDSIPLPFAGGQSLSVDSVFIEE